MALLFNSSWDDPEEWSRELVGLMPDLEIRVSPQEGAAEDIEFALIWEPPSEGLKSFPNLRAILMTGAGVEHILGHPEIPDGMPIARNVDPGLTQKMTEYVALAVLRHHRRFDEYERLGREGRWLYHAPADTERRRVGVMGLGALGSDAAGQLVKLGFDVAGWSRSRKELENIHSFHGSAELTPFLERTDILVCLLPHTPATVGIINAQALAALPRGACVVNPARGAHVVDEDLLAALESGHVAGATLDVFHEEPLPSSHAFWGHDKVLVTPHIASIGSARTSAPQIVENIRRARRGRSAAQPGGCRQRLLSGTLACFLYGARSVNSSPPIHENTDYEEAHHDDRTLANRLPFWS